jgi:PPK2 family polyphosphate:nucleotide phosphotransferase
MNQEDFLIAPGSKIKLKDFDTAFTGSYADEASAEKKTSSDCAALAELQDKLMAQATDGLLLIFQAMDGSGKDGTIKHIMSAADPQGCKAHNFKPPSEIELKHDYLRHFHQSVPARGEIGVFNRSYYEEVLVARVHAERLEEEKLPPSTPKGNKLWQQRFRQINDFELYLTENGIHIMKFFLHLSRSKQRQRLLERIVEPDKRWKFSATDLRDREHWNEYMRAYEDMLSNTSTVHAPWYAIPADNRWFTSLAVGSLIVEKLKRLKPRYPKAKSTEMDEAKLVLEREA